MIKSIEFVRFLGDGTVVSKNIELGAPETSGLWIKSIKGIGPGKADINITDMASSDGGIFNSSRSQTRNITLTLGLVDYTDSGTYYSVEAVRRDTYKIFGKKNLVTVYVHTDKVDLYTQGYIESCDPDIFNKQETMSISIICPDPNFYSLDGHEQIDFSATGSLFEFPMNYAQTSDNSFVLDTSDVPNTNSNGQFYYEYDQENDQYYFTEDTSAQAGKTYYTGGLMNDTDESQSEDEYFVTEDTEFIKGKEYFEKDDKIQYMRTHDDSMLIGKDYYELINKEYVITSDSSLIPGKIYYEIDETDQYILTFDLEMDSQKTYYEYNNKLVFAEILDLALNDLSYDGEIQVGVTIDLRFNGEVSGVAIYKYLDESTNEEMYIDDVLLPETIGSINAGDEIIICTVKGNKSATLIREGESYNIMNALGRNPNWFQLDYGSNIFGYSATIGEELIEVSISYDAAYEGV